MLRKTKWMSAATALAVCLYFSGCGSSDSASTGAGGGATPVAETGHEGHDHEGHDHAGHDHEGHDHGDASPDKIAQAMSELSAEDRVLAEQQKICPVGLDSLGTMGKPFKVTLDDGRVVFLCCEGCEETLRQDPDKYLANLQPKGDQPQADPATEEKPQDEPAPPPQS